MANNRLWLVACVSIALVALSACGSSSHSTITPARTEFLYSITVTGTPPSISAGLASFTLDPTSGAVTQTSSSALNQLTDGIAVRPDAEYLYISDPEPQNSFIDIYSLDSKTGAATADGAYLLSSICAFCAPASAPGILAMNASGTSLYYGSATLGGGIRQGLGALASDSQSGMLSAVTGSPFSANLVPFFVTLHPSEQFLYTEDISGSDPEGFALQSVSAYPIDPSTGALGAAVSYPPSANAEATGFAVHPSGKFLYVSTGATGNGILAWSIDSATGALTPFAGSPLQAGTDSFGIAFDPAGDFLYTSAGASGGIYAYNVDANSGALTAVSGSPFFAGTLLGDAMVDPSGQLLIAAEGKTNSIVVFERDAATGALGPQLSSTTVNGSPSWLTMVQSSQ